jgi:hypothetical protein
MNFDEIMPYLEDTSFRKDYTLYNSTVPIDNKYMESCMVKWHPDPRVLSNLDQFIKTNKPGLPYILQIIKNHWVTAVQKEKYTMIFDSYGTPLHYLAKKANSEYRSYILNNCIVGNAHAIYQFPFSNVCGAYAYFFCKGLKMYNNAFYYLSDLFSISFDKPDEWFKQITADYFTMLQENDRKIYALFMKEPHD